MDTEHRDLARACLEGAEAGEMTFPDVVGALTTAGFDGYAVDFRRGEATYFLPDGEFVDVRAHRRFHVAQAFDGKVVREAIREAQQAVDGHTYKGFCTKVTEAGCAAYVVSFPGRRVLYYGRTGETHTEFFPAAGA